MTQTAPQDKDISVRYHAIMAHCRRYNGADTARSLRILVFNFAVFFALLAVIYHAHFIWGILFLLPAAFMLVRIFIVQHDCGHGSFFKSKRANDAVGRFISLFTFAPYGYWGREHDVHHAYVGQIDRQDIGYIDILTADDYAARSFLQKLLYRLYRHPLVLLVAGVPLHNIVLLRVPPLSRAKWDDRHFLSFADAWKSVMGHNAALLVFWGGLGYVFGFGALFMVYLPVLVLGWQIGGWMFYVHHHFEDAYWQGGDDWHPHAARLYASSYYKLPDFWQWATGYIGLHQIHHFSSGIPHYKLADCMRALPELQDMNPVTFRESLRSIWLAIIDPTRRKMIRLSDLG